MALAFQLTRTHKKLKTNCIAWLKYERTLPNLVLCGNQLPWVDKITHLGINLTNEKDMLACDMNVKKAKYISKNIEINQEFHFAAPETKVKVNEIYNSSWYGSVLYNLYNKEAIKLESSYNRSVKVMLDLPFGTHRGLIEPLIGRKHQRLSFIKIFFYYDTKDEGIKETSFKKASPRNRVGRFINNREQLKKYHDRNL